MSSLICRSNSEECRLVSHRNVGDRYPCAKLRRSQGKSKAAKAVMGDFGIVHGQDW